MQNPTHNTTPQAEEARPDVAQFKRWLHENRALIQDVMVNKANAKTIRATVDAYTQPVFEQFEFFTSRRSPLALTARITNPKHLYLCEDEELMARYYAACDQAHRAHGYNLEPGYCPALVAEHELIKAESALLKAASEFFGFEAYLLHGESREQMLETLMRAYVHSLNH